MNCLFVSPIRRDWGRAETWMLRLAVGLRARGDACAILADPDSRWEAECRREGLRYWPCPIGFRGGPQAWIGLRAAVRRQRSDAVIVRGFAAARFVRAVEPSMAVLLKLPDPSDLGETLADRLTFRFGVDRVLVDSYAVRDHYRRFPWVPPGKIVAVHTGIPVEGAGPNPADRNRARALWGISSDTLVVGVAANLVARSRVMDALEAFTRARLSADARFVILGDGPMLGELKRRAAVHGLSSSVLFPGWLDEAPRLLSGLDVYLHTSLEEGLPRAMLEAMAGGVCCLAVRAGGASEILRDAEDGFLVPPGDLNRFAGRLRDLAADPALRARAGSAAARRIRSEFSLEAMAGRAHDALADTIGHRRLLRRRMHPEVDADGWRWIRSPEMDGTPAAATERREFLESSGVLFGLRPRRPRAVRLFRRARRLALLDTHTAPHLAAGWHRRRDGRVESVLVLSHPGGWTPAAGWLGRTDHAPERRRFLRSLAIWLGRRHGAGIVPHGLRMETLRVRETEGSWEFALADVDACALRWKPSLREIAEQMAELLRSVAAHAPRSDLYRFAAEYRRVRHLHRATMRQLLMKMEAMRDG